jgi:molybdopterin-guanine dinucleotide biosynthesis protein B
VAEPPPLLGIAGWSGSGKTTLIERLIAALTAHGFRIATVKHTHHALKRGDTNTDGARHARAGAVAVAVIGPQEWELAGVVQPSPPPSLAEAVACLAPANLVLVEGFKSAPIPKIEVRRGLPESPLTAYDRHVVAIASDQPVDVPGLPVFELDDVPAITEFVVRIFALRANP